MIHTERLAKLRSLLERVRSRAAEPRLRAGGTVRPTPAKEASAAALAEPEAVTSTTSTVLGWSKAEAEPAIVAHPGPAEAESVQEEAPESDGHDSRERLVAAQPAAPDAVQMSVPMQESAPPIDVAELEIPAQELPLDDAPGDSADEGPPSSSRRPLVAGPEERLAQMAFGADEPPQPIHTPPPESGRLPAAPTTEFEPDVDVTGVRNATPILPRRGPEPTLRELSPQAITPEFEPGDRVAEVIAEAQRFAPATFVEWLDASLGL